MFQRPIFWNSAAEHVKPTYMSVKPWKGFFGNLGALRQTHESKSTELGIKTNIHNVWFMVHVKTKDLFYIHTSQSAFKKSAIFVIGTK
jgi:hypothetical protein